MPAENDQYPWPERENLAGCELVGLPAGIADSLNTFEKSRIDWQAIGSALLRNATHMTPFGGVIMYYARQSLAARRSSELPRQ